MKFKQCGWWICWSAMALLAIGFGNTNLPRAQEDDEADSIRALAGEYGFQPLEILKLSDRSANMLSGDLNNDGLNDLVVADNGKSRIDILLQRATKPASDPSSKVEVNQFAAMWRFEHRKLSVDHEISAMALGDFNNDKRTDIAYFAVPDKLIVRYQPKSGDWTEKTTVRLPDVPALPWLVAAGDLNSDGRDDIAVLGLSQTYVLHQDKVGKLSPPENLFNTSDRCSLGQITDLDGDGRKDLCYMSHEELEQALAVRLQGPDGRLGPELRFPLTKPRSVSIAQLDKTPQTEVLAVDATTGRLKVFQMDRPEPKAGELSSRIIQYGFGQQGAGRDRDIAIADVNGDGGADVIVADPEAARMIVFLQRPGSGLDQGEAFSGLVGAEIVRAADLDGDKRAEVVVISSKEKTIGLSRMQDGRLTFPQALPIGGKEPVALELADLDGDQKFEIVYLTKARAARETSYTFEALRRSADGKWEPYQFDGKPSVPLELKTTPNRLMKADINGDGRIEFMVFAGSDKPPTLFQLSEQGLPKEIKPDGGIQLGNVAPGAVYFGQLQGPAMLIAQEKFVRHMRFDEQVGGWQVVDQFNTSEVAAKTVGAATLNLDGQPGNELVLIDVGLQRLRILRRADNTYEPWQEIEIGRFPFRSAHVADLNGDGQDDLLLMGHNKFGVLYSGQSLPALREVASFETKRDKSFFADLVGGDLNNDGLPDLAAIDTQSHFVDLFRFTPAAADKPARLQLGLTFQVFEEKSFSREDEGGDAEPRESLIVDVTNDGLPDLVLLVHDRILIYPQDDGRGEHSANAAR